MNEGVELEIGENGTVRKLHLRGWDFQWELAPEPLPYFINPRCVFQAWAWAVICSVHKESNLESTVFTCPICSLWALLYPFLFHPSLASFSHCTGLSAWIFWPYWTTRTMNMHRDGPQGVDVTSVLFHFKCMLSCRTAKHLGVFS